MKVLLRTYTNDSVTREYLPEGDMLDRKGVPEKDFFYGVISTLKTDEVRGRIDAALKKRFEKEEGGSSENVIVVSEEWKTELMRLPFTSCKYSFIE